MEHASPEDGYTPVDLREYLGVIRARKWSIILITLLVLGLALTYSYSQEPTYRAGARLLVKPIPSAGYFPSVSLETESQLVSSELVAQRAARIMGEEDAGGLLGGLSVSPVAESQVLEIFYSSTDPERAAEAANAFAEGFIVYQEQQANRTLTDQVQEIQGQIDEIEEELNDVLAQIDKATKAQNASRLGRLRVEETALSTRLGTLQQQMAELQQNGLQSAQEGGEVIQGAGVPAEPYAPNHIANGLMGFFLGLALGFGWAFLRQRLDNRFRGRTDVERVVEAPVLSTISKIRGRKQQDRLVVLAAPQSAVAEAYRTLRTSVLFLAKENGLKVFAVTSPREAEGKTLTAANLAVGIGKTGQRVALISGDMRRPTLELYFQVDESTSGLSTWLTGDGSVLPPLLLTNADNVDLLPCGPVPHNPAELLTSPRVFDLIEELKRRYDFVIFDTPPVLPVADVATLASAMDGTLLVLDAGKSHRSHTMQAREDLTRVGADIVGVILNNYDPSDSPYYYYTAVQYSESYSSNGHKTKRRSKGRRRLFGRR